MCSSCLNDGDKADKTSAEQAVQASLRVRQFHLILADIAVSAAARSCGHPPLACSEPYVPGALRDLWQEIAPDDALLRRVNALASAGVGALQGQSGEAIAAAASRYGVPLEAELATDIAGHFAERRDAVLTYDR